MSKRQTIIIVGVDLAGSPRRPTGICTLRDMKAFPKIVYEDQQILDALVEAKPDLVPIDAPLSLPRGRQTIHDRKGEHLRECDREL